MRVDRSSLGREKICIKNGSPRSRYCSIDEHPSLGCFYISLLFLSRCSKREGFCVFLIDVDSQLCVFMDDMADFMGGRAVGNH